MKLATHQPLQQERLMNFRPGSGTHEIGIRDRKNSSDTEPAPVAAATPTAQPGDSYVDLSMAAMAFLQAPVAIIVCNTEYEITLVNAFAREMAQKDPQGQSIKSARNIWGEILDEEGCHIPVEECPCTLALQGQAIAARECELVCSNGKSYHVMISAAPIRSTAGKIVAAVVIIVDISRELTGRNEAVTNERTRIAGNIHDNVSQGLNAAVLQIRAARQELAKHVRLTRVQLRQALESTINSLEEARRATSTFSDYDDIGDPGAVLQYVAQKLFSGSRVRVECTLAEPLENLPPHHSLELVRIGKEALTNVLKHADASVVKIDLKYYRGTVELRVADNGHGFVLASRPNTKAGFGLVSMRVRAERQGGEVQIESELGKGTSVTARLPI